MEDAIPETMQAPSPLYTREQRVKNNNKQNANGTLGNFICLCFYLCLSMFMFMYIYT